MASPISIPKRLARKGLLLAITLGPVACSGGHRSIASLSGSLVIGPEIRSIAIELVDGSLEILAAAPDSQGLEYQGILRRAATTVDDLAQLERLPLGLLAQTDPENPARLVVRGPMRPAELAGRSVLGLELTVRLPAHLALQANVTGSGHLTVEDRRNTVQLRTGRGDLRVTGCIGSADISTGTGMTIVYEHRGDLSVDTMLGDMQVFMREPRDLIRLVTGHGNIQCLVPPDSGFRLDARAETGKVSNGFGLPLERQGYCSSMVGDRGDRHTEIVMRTSSGSLSLSYKNWGG